MNSHWKRILYYVPAPLSPLLRAFYSQLASLVDQQLASSSGLATIPDVHLRYRVQGSPLLSSYLDTGRHCANDLAEAVRLTGSNLPEFHDLLDFGVGCGRVLTWLQRELSAHIHGCDIDAEAVLWCEKNLKGLEGLPATVSFSVCNRLPPLPLSEESFDLVYATSVFTHFSEEVQFAWLAELHRILRSNGLGLISVNGKSRWRELSREAREKVKECGFVLASSRFTDPAFPEWSQNAYVSEAYVRERWNEYFEVLNYVPLGMNQDQDLVVLRKHP
jgi:SAM-dependent methyltransferase